MVLIILSFIVAAFICGVKAWNNFAEAHNKRAKEYNEFLKSYLDARAIIIKNFSVFSNLGISYYTDSAKLLMGIANRLLIEDEQAIKKDAKSWAKNSYKEYKKIGDFNKFLSKKFAAIMNLFKEYGINDFASYEIEKDLQKLIYRK